MVQLVTGSVCGDLGPQLHEISWPADRCGSITRKYRMLSQAAAGGCVVSVLGAAVAQRRLRGRRRFKAIVTLGMAASVTALAIATSQLGWPWFKITIDQKNASRIPQDTSSRVAKEEADIVWGVLKSFSLLEVRDKAGSIHRLLQEVCGLHHPRLVYVPNPQPTVL